MMPAIRERVRDTSNPGPSENQDSKWTTAKLSSLYITLTVNKKISFYCQKLFYCLTLQNNSKSATKGKQIESPSFVLDNTDNTCISNLGPFSSKLKANFFFFLTKGGQMIKKLK